MARSVLSILAAQAFIDKQYGRPEELVPDDNDNYSLVEIGGHEIAIAVMTDGEYGISSAASVARDMLHSFSSIRIGLMIDIGSGAPSQKHYIRLGVVSASRDGNCYIPI